MKEFVDEVIRRFPEIRERIFKGDEELPYLVVRHVVDWLAKQDRKPLQEDIVKRVVDFNRWAMAQPRGQTAEDDISTIGVCGFVEHLFEHDNLFPLIPRIMSKAELMGIADLIKQREGEARFNQVVKLFRRKP